jgi:quercetin dioxygenase-like cupin family protein
MKLFDVHPCLADDRQGKTKMYPYFKEEEKPSDKFDSGFIIFPPGAVMPSEGKSCHTGYEVSYVISGTLTIEANGQVMTFQDGNTIYIPAGEAHRCVNNGDVDCVVAYMIVQG